MWYAKRGILRGDPDNVHIKKLTGQYLDKEGNRSPFNFEKWAFLLDSPFPISSECCDYLKKEPFKKYEHETGRKRITAMMTDESRLRTLKWLQYGCNGFDMKRPTSNPMSFWTEQDVLKYIQENNIEICSVYGDIVPDYEEMGELDGQMDISDYGLINDNRKLKTTGCYRTGCMYCGYGCHLDREPRFVKMKETHPKQYDYIMKPREKGGLGYREIIDWLNEHGGLNIKY